MFSMVITDKKKVFFYIFIISLLFKPLWLFETNKINEQDDLSYWLHSHTVANDFDIGNLERKNLSNSVNHERLLNNPINFDRIQINKIFNLN